MIFVDIIFKFDSLAVMPCLTIRKRDRNENNVGAGHIGDGILDDATPSNVCGDLGTTCVKNIWSFGVDLTRGVDICSKYGK